jgi:hypothetical protein
VGHVDAPEVDRRRLDGDDLDEAEADRVGTTRPPAGEHAKVRAVRAGEEGHLADLARLAITLLAAA